MTNEKERGASLLVQRARARLATALSRPGSGTADPRRRPSATGGRPVGSAQVERWMDGTAKDPIVRLEEELDEQRFLVDSEYQARPDVLEKVSRLVKLRHERDAKTPPPLAGRHRRGWPRSRPTSRTARRSSVTRRRRRLTARSTAWKSAGARSTCLARWRGNEHRQLP